jgi:integrase
MDFEKLCNTYDVLIKHMKDNGYFYGYVRRLKTEINWLVKNKEKEKIQSYEEAYRIRRNCTKSSEMRRWYRLAYGILKRFDVHNQYPDRISNRPLIKRGAYSQLNDIFKEVINLYNEADMKRGLKKHTIYGNASAGSCFLLAMQNRGCLTLEDITEDDTMSFFTDNNNIAVLSNCYKKEVATVFKANLGIHTEAARRILAYIPMIRSKRSNIPYLSQEEAKAVHRALGDRNNGLSLRTRAIGYLLFFTGIRGCDIVQLEFSDIDWEKEEIRLNQQKTGNVLVLPLTAVIGNAIFDYITMERHASSDTYIFLGKLKPYAPLKPGGMWYISSKIYTAASIRQEPGDRRGCHLFRYHVATFLAGKGIARPVISDTLGHTTLASLDYYLSADIVHLRECALSIETFPVNQEVFKI